MRPDPFADGGPFADVRPESVPADPAAEGRVVPFPRRAQAPSPPSTPPTCDCGNPIGSAPTCGQCGALVAKWEGRSHKLRSAERGVGQVPEGAEPGDVVRVVYRDGSGSHLRRLVRLLCFRPDVGGLWAVEHVAEADVARPERARARARSERLNGSGERPFSRSAALPDPDPAPESAGSDPLDLGRSAALPDPEERLNGRAADVRAREDLADRDALLSGADPLLAGWFKGVRAAGQPVGRLALDALGEDRPDAERLLLADGWRIRDGAYRPAAP